MTAPAITVTPLRDRLLSIADYALYGASRIAGDSDSDTGARAATDEVLLAEVFSSVERAPTDWEAYIALMTGITRTVGITGEALAMASLFAAEAGRHPEGELRAALMQEADRALNGGAL